MFAHLSSIILSGPENYAILKDIFRAIEEDLRRIFRDGLDVGSEVAGLFIIYD